MTSLNYRAADLSDVPAMARLRALEWETEAYWTGRISGYLRREVNPQLSLQARAIYVALDGVALVGFAAGHLTRRYGCEGELEWINVAPERRGAGVAAGLLRTLAAWFVEQGVHRVC